MLPILFIGLISVGVSIGGVTGLVMVVGWSVGPFSSLSSAGKSNEISSNCRIVAGRGAGEGFES